LVFYYLCQHKHNKYVESITTRRRFLERGAVGNIIGGNEGLGDVAECLPIAENSTASRDGQLLLVVDHPHHVISSIVILVQLH